MIKPAHPEHPAHPAHPAHPEHPAHTEIRVLSYNVRSLRDDRAALARVVEACRPDVVCVQESPRFFGWRRAARQLARSVGFRVICGGADASGCLLMGPDSTVIEHTETLYLEHRRGFHLRGMALAVLRVGGARFTVGATHLSLDAAQRVDQAGEALCHLDRLATAFGTPTVVLGGDFNSHPGSPEWHVLVGRLRDAWAEKPAGEGFTSTAADPYQRIDAVFASENAEIVGAGVPVHLATPADMAAASDHRPVLAVLRVRSDA